MIRSRLSNNKKYLTKFNSARPFLTSDYAANSIMSGSNPPQVFHALITRPPHPPSAGNTQNILIAGLLAAKSRPPMS